MTEENKPMKGVLEVFIDDKRLSCHIDVENLAEDAELTDEVKLLLLFLAGIKEFLLDPDAFSMIIALGLASVVDGEDEDVSHKSVTTITIDSETAGSA